MIDYIKFFLFDSVTFIPVLVNADFSTKYTVQKLQVPA